MKSTAPVDSFVSFPQGREQPQVGELAETMADRPGYHVEVAGPGLVRVSREYYSYTRVVIAVILALFTFGLGLLILLQRDKENFAVEIAIAPTGQGAGARVVGTVSPQSRSILEMWSRGASLPQAVPAAPPAPSPAFPEAEPAHAAPAHAGEAEPVAAAPVTAALSDAEAEDDFTRRVQPEPVCRFAARLDDGQSWSLGARTVVGRAPEPLPDDGEECLLIPVDDPEKSISKSHFLIEVHQAVIRVVDLDSTNGTSVRESDDARTPVPKVEGVVVSPGTAILFGDRVMTLEQV